MIWYKSLEDYPFTNPAHLPSGAVMPAPTNMTDVSQFIGRFAPTDSPRAQPLWRIPPHRKCVVTSEDEHAVSMLTLGPCTIPQCISRAHMAAAA
jgi:hypothetical protein